MSEIRIQVAYHFKIDPAKQLPGAVLLPEQITRTVAVGDDFTPEKVSLDSLPLADQAIIREVLEKKVAEATRTARPAGSPAPVPAAAADEMSAF